MIEADRDVVASVALLGEQRRKKSPSHNSEYPFLRGRGMSLFALASGTLVADPQERTGAKSQTVQVLYEPRDRFTHKLVIDRGSSDGVRPGNPVIDEQGVVGQVTRVFPLVSEVTVLTERPTTSAVFSTLKPV